MKDTDLLIDVDVEIPHGIQMGFDDAGLPITVPAEKAEKEPKAPKKEAKDEPAPITLAQLEAANRERDAERAARAKAEADAKAAREAAEAVTGKLGKTENLLHDRTIQGAAAHWRSVHSEHQQITSAIASTEALALSYEKELAAASEAGDHAKIASTQRAIARAEAHLAQLEAGKAASAQEVERAERLYREVNAAPPEKEEPKPKTEPEPKQADAPVQVTPDQWIENVKTTVGEDGTAWLKAHKDYVTDPKLNRKLLRFAEDYADDHGVEALKTAAFVEALNEKFDPKAKEAAVNKQAAAEAAEAEEEEVEEEQEVPVKRSVAAAPVSRASNPGAGGTGGGKSKVVLSPLEQKTAYEMYPNLDPVEARTRYANNKARALADGKYK